MSISVERNEYFDVVERFRIRSERFAACVEMTPADKLGARANRGVPMPEDRMDALIWGLGHESPVVRRVCLEFLDQHPHPRALPHVVACLEDPVPRVRWHAVHAICCDVCKDGSSQLTPELVARVRQVAESDPSPKVRGQALHGLREAGELSD